MALLTTEDVLNKKFQYVKFREGYDQDEVDEFLDEVVSTIYSLQMENQELKEKLEAAERRVAELSNGDFTPVETPAPAVVETPAPVMPAFAVPQDPDSATSMLALAQRVHDEYVRDGEEQSAKIPSFQTTDNILKTSKTIKPNGILAFWRNYSGG